MVGEFDAVLERAQLQRHAAAVAAAGGADLLRVDHAFVGEFAEQRLHVAHFVARGHQVDVAAFWQGAAFTVLAGLEGPPQEEPQPRSEMLNTA